MSYVAEGFPTAQVKGSSPSTRFQHAPVENQVWSLQDPVVRAGAKDIIGHCEKRSAFTWAKPPDGKVTLRTAECLASCGTAPMMQVDKKYYENLTTTEVDRILDRLLLDS
jgi:NADH-quinone oxidoreductase subunit E